nr:MAG TPA: hypothetical protein [Caudoviricetes sp.]
MKQASTDDNFKQALELIQNEQQYRLKHGLYTKENDEDREV